MGSWPLPGGRRPDSGPEPAFRVRGGRRAGHGHGPSFHGRRRDRPVRRAVPLNRAARGHGSGQRDVGPYLDVTTERIRLRILNASPARVYDFGLDDGSELAVVASDGGLLPAPFRTDRVRLSPGERAEVVVTMTPGEERVLRSHPTPVASDPWSPADGRGRRHPRRPAAPRSRDARPVTAAARPARGRPGPGP